MKAEPVYTEAGSSKSAPAKVDKGTQTVNRSTRTLASPSRDADSDSDDEATPTEISIGVWDIFTNEESLLWALRARLYRAIAELHEIQGGMGGQRPEDRSASASRQMVLTMQFNNTEFSDETQLMMAADRRLVRMLECVLRGQTIGLFRARATSGRLPVSHR